MRVPEINSPADIYKYFPRRVGFEDELSETESSSSEEIGSRENNSDSDGQLSDDHKVRSPSNTQRTGTSVRGKTVKKCLIKKRLRKQQLNCYTHINKHSTTWHKRYWSDVRIDKCHGRDNDVSRDEKIPN